MILFVFTMIISVHRIKLINNCKVLNVYSVNNIKKILIIVLTFHFVPKVKKNCINPID